MKVCPFGLICFNVYLSFSFVVETYFLMGGFYDYIVVFVRYVYNMELLLVLRAFGCESCFETSFAVNHWYSSNC